ncbi:hypothetical protein BJI69_12620 [Luteibacter rhizovicinus DSM 16549]|uniref:Uncharacterized protein n=1 Tax=Luteibacter rhizovicinus DSM 16549 TaxID=1440763 RepID=A0A0G9HEJ1_9GAMM|nr:hypothetical protein [Luteibacter rhizovicinus]APG04659.1 hypothetical protein BJI69_12620 [Luteibacter rhizovicinus DSM 16549]KLD68150.1 hypothetical protein Y883_03355 [Luteibacter rhizovicinus DSM 16549]
MRKSLPAFLLASAVALGGTGTALAGDPGRLPDLPACVLGQAYDGACLLPLKDGQFTDGSLSSWRRVGLPGHGVDPDGMTYAALPTGSGISQAVYAHTGQNTADAVYAVRFRVRAEHDQAQVRATLSMSTDQGAGRVVLGHITSTAQAEEWSTVALSVQGRPYAAPAHVLLEIENEGGAHTTVQVDDVALVQNTDVDVL